MDNGLKLSLQPRFPPRARRRKAQNTVMHRKEGSAVTLWPSSISSGMPLCLEAFNLIEAMIITFFLFTLRGLHA